jgi:AcrR family transcriptional regulator
VSRRPYDASGRKAAAAQTQAHVVEVATRLLLERGYAATSVADVAAQSGVSTALVYAAFGNKAGLVKRVVDVAIAGDDAPVAVGDRPAAAAVAEARSARTRCRLTGELVASISRRTSALLPVLRTAAAADPDIDELVARQEQGLRVGMREFVGILDADDQLRGGLDVERAADIAWVLADVSAYHRLVLQRGWSHEEYAAWLGTALYDGLCRR